MVSRLRERIGKEWIETVWGFGYRLRSVTSSQ
jgi:DNA-binding response OmpR family regulator